jgi:hypothetical protein
MVGTCWHHEENASSIINIFYADKRIFEMQTKETSDQ